jgi:hypothetical protein
MHTNGMTLVLGIAAFVWFCVGATGVHYWWRWQFGESPPFHLVLVESAIFGPLTWAVGWWVHAR